MSKSEETESVRLPADLIERFDDRVPYTEFDDAAKYIAYVLEEVMSTVEDDHDIEAGTTVDEGQVQGRLESLGYLNE